MSNITQKVISHKINKNRMCAQVKIGKYSGTFKVNGLSPEFNLSNDINLIGKTIDMKSELYKNLRLLDHKYCKYEFKAHTLSRKLFESAAEKDEEENWRYEDCVNFNYDKYISQEPEKPILDAYWEKVSSIKIG